MATQCGALCELGSHLGDIAGLQHLTAQLEAMTSALTANSAGPSRADLICLSRSLRGLESVIARLRRPVQTRIEKLQAVLPYAL